MCLDVLLAIALTFAIRGHDNVLDQKEFISCMVIAKCADPDDMPDEAKECLVKRLKR